MSGVIQRILPPVLFGPKPNNLAKQFIALSAVLAGIILIPSASYLAAALLTLIGTYCSLIVAANQNDEKIPRNLQRALAQQVVQIAKAFAMALLLLGAYTAVYLTVIRK